MPVDPATGMAMTYEGRRVVFCSDFCRRAFEASPEKYAAPPLARVPTESGVSPQFAYFSMEVGVDASMPTYAGGLGVLAGDTLKTFADLGIPAIGVTLLYRKGYFEQKMDAGGEQKERPANWEPSTPLHLLPNRVQVTIEGRPVEIQAWQFDIIGAAGRSIPLLLLDTDFAENQTRDRQWTQSLYGGDPRYRLAQEIVLGIGGVRMLRALQCTRLRRYHMNEGHAALLAVELLRENRADNGSEWAFHVVRDQCVFTTHTPVPAGHDQFSYDLVSPVLGEILPREVLEMLAGKERLNMTLLALNLSGYVNGVAKKHGLVSQEMFPGYPIDSITNGVHAKTWTCPSFRELFDRHIPGWAGDPFTLRHAISIPHREIRDAHQKARAALFQELARRGVRQFDPEALTIGFARRATRYKRADLVLSDLEELVDIAKNAGPLQFVFAGKAHPRDEEGKELIREVFRAARDLDGKLPIAYLENYDMELAKILTSGVDLWLNTPLPPLEASGTSGMKAALNGVPSLSVLDGWWIEGHIEGVTGWSVSAKDGDEARDLYRKLRTVIVPLYYQADERWSDVMRQTIAFNASFFNSHRMVQQYLAMAYA
jgi:starch phosphorylase